jgi:2,3-dihydroxy-2,3-dihydro-p-cumate dehydrogenase
MINNSMDFEGRVVIVTGAAKGQGFDIARHFASVGASLVLGDVDGDGLSSAVEELLTEFSDTQIEASVVDLSKEEGAKALCEKSVAAFGKIDALINNAGGGVIRPFLDHTLETLTETLNRNLWTVIWMCRAAVPHMVEREYGRIVNIGADSVRNGLPSHAVYNAAKGGVHGLTTGLAREFATKGVTVNTVAPGGILTPEIRNMLDPESDVYNKHAIQNINELLVLYPMGRFAEMDEVSSMTVYLASEAARYVTGQVVSVNGGSTML